MGLKTILTSKSLSDKLPFENLIVEITREISERFDIC